MNFEELSHRLEGALSEARTANNHKDDVLKRWRSALFNGAVVADMVNGEKRPLVILSASVNKEYPDLDGFNVKPKYMLHGDKPEFVGIDHLVPWTKQDEDRFCRKTKADAIIKLVAGLSLEHLLRVEFMIMGLSMDRLPPISPG